MITKLIILCGFSFLCTYGMNSDEPILTKAVMTVRMGTIDPALADRFRKAGASVICHDIKHLINIAGCGPMFFRSNPTKCTYQFPPEKPDTHENTQATL